jgi:hypothetical protein
MSSSRPATRRSPAARVVAALVGIALGVAVATLARETVEAGAPAFRAAFTRGTHHLAVQAHPVPEPLAREPVDDRPEPWHREPKPETGERAEVPTF